MSSGTKLHQKCPLKPSANFGGEPVKTNSFPDLLLCNKQLHSKYKFKKHYPNLTEEMIRALHYTTGLTLQKVDYIAPEWNQVGCQIFKVNLKH